MSLEAAALRDVKKAADPRARAATMPTRILREHFFAAIATVVCE